MQAHCGHSGQVLLQHGVRFLYSVQTGDCATVQVVCPQALKESCPLTNTISKELQLGGVLISWSNDAEA